MIETVFSSDGFVEVARWLSAHDVHKVLVLCGSNRRFVDGALVTLAPFVIEVFDGARVHVPAEVVERATSRMDGVHAIVAIGGGSAIGLGKALRLAHESVKFVAVPTTYAGSEMTTMFGITRERDKQTGRDPRVRPDLVVYDTSLARDMPIALTVQSMLNAVAHTASIGDGFTATHDALRAIEDLLLAPRSLVAREHAARAASACAAAFELGKPGAQHGLAHLLGGALGVDHAPLHAILLPHFLAHLRATGAIEAIERAVDRADLDAYVHDLLVRAGAPVALTAIGGTLDNVRAALATRPELPAKIAIDALHGLRPPGRGGRVDLDGVEGVLIGPPIARAKTVVVAIHGRGAEAGTIARRYREIAGHDPDTAIIGLRAGDTAGSPVADRWYPIRYGEPGAGRDPDVIAALARIDRAIRSIDHPRIILAGFSQGSCLALEYAATRGDKLAAVIAPCGARIGQPADWDQPAPGRFAGRVLIGAAHGDKWIARADLDATAAWFGDVAEIVDGPGDKHEIAPLQRIRAREIILDRPNPRGPGGFGSTVEQEAIAGALPARQNSPRVPAHGLYAEQISGVGFTTPRADNARTWCYRVRPSSQRRPFVQLQNGKTIGSFGLLPMIELAGFAPLERTGDVDFVDGLVTLCGAGDARHRRGYAIHRYAANRSMTNRAFYSADGDFVIIPERGALHLLTELGPLDVPVGSIAIVPRGILFSVLLRDAEARGYVGEPFGARVRLSERGPVGANGLADARHFRMPAPWFEDRLAPDFRVVGKLGGFLREASQDHSPFDVVAWHGNYAPMVYDLADFSPVANVGFDHGDPSIYSVVSAPGELDLIVFPPRWDSTTNTFRPPYFHRNAIAEINGIVREPHASRAFQPGCVFITPPMTAHGPSGRAVERARRAPADAPEHLHGSIWFQFETPLPPSPSPWATPLEDWAATWGSHRAYFHPFGE